MFDPVQAHFRSAEMETIDIVPLIEQLDDNIDDLEAALDPLLKEALPDIAGKLPLLDQAELYVLVTYAIESTLFCKSSTINVIINSNRCQHTFVSMVSTLKSIPFSES